MEYKFIERIKYLDYCIANRKTGNRIQLSSRMNISKSSLHNYISFMKQYGAPIKFCRSTNSYKYTDADYRFSLSFAEKIKSPIVLGQLVLAQLGPQVLPYFIN
jgi:predicted DNA-binding transcriptional regulator YafY